MVHPSRHLVATSHLLHRHTCTLHFTTWGDKHAWNNSLLLGVISDLWHKLWGDALLQSELFLSLLHCHAKDGRVNLLGYNRSIKKVFEIKHNSLCEPIRKRQKVSNTLRSYFFFPFFFLLCCCQTLSCFNSAHWNTMFLIDNCQLRRHKICYSVLPRRGSSHVVVLFM